MSQYDNNNSNVHYAPVKQQDYYPQANQGYPAPQGNYPPPQGYPGSQNAPGYPGAQDQQQQGYPSQQGYPNNQQQQQQQQGYPGSPIQQGYPSQQGYSNNQQQQQQQGYPGPSNQQGNPPQGYPGDQNGQPAQGYPGDQSGHPEPAEIPAQDVSFVYTPVPGYPDPKYPWQIGSSYANDTNVQNGYPTHGDQLYKPAAKDEDPSNAYPFGANNDDCAPPIAKPLETHQSLGATLRDFITVGQVFRNILVIGIWGGVAGLFNRNWDQNLCGWVIGVCALIYIFSIFISGTFKSLCNMKSSANGLQEHILDVRNSVPSINWSITCYHYENRTRYVRTKDKDGNEKERIEHYRERVNTWYNNGTFDYRFWRDVSVPLGDISKFEMTRVEFKKDYIFADGHSYKQYKNQRDRFIYKNRRDIHYDFSENLHVPNYVENAICSITGKFPAWMNTPLYLLASFLTLESVFTFAFKYVSQRVDYRYVKQFAY